MIGWTLMVEYGRFGFGRVPQGKQGNLFPSFSLGVFRFSWCHGALTAAICSSIASTSIVASASRIETLEAEVAENLTVIGQLQLDLAKCRKQFAVSCRGQNA